MREASIIKKTPILRTRDSIAHDLRQLGLSKGMMVIVHTSLSSLGWVCGGAIAVIQALMDVITPSGTIVMPAHSGEYSEPSYWGNPPVPEAWWPIIRETMPAFQPEITPTRGIGIVAETFRTFPGVVRSSHPALSFTAWGKDAEKIVSNHELDYSLGENSPLARIYASDGWILLLGADYSSNTSFHLSENRASGATTFQAGAPVIEDGKRLWKTYTDVEFDTDMFVEIGPAFEKEYKIVSGLVGSAKSKLIRQRDAVDFAQKWIENRRRNSNSIHQL